MGRGGTDPAPSRLAALGRSRDDWYGRVVGRERGVHHGTAARMDRGTGGRRGREGETNGRTYVCAWIQPGPENRKRVLWKDETHTATTKFGDAGARVDRVGVWAVVAWRRTATAAPEKRRTCEDRRRSGEAGTS